MAMISYAQNGEDVLLDRVFRGQACGFYVDVGAADPVIDSVTKHFYDRGWHGINVEPFPRSYDALRASRPRDVNLNVGLSDHEGTLTLYEVPQNPELCTFVPRVGERYRQQGLVGAQRPVPVTTLARVCAEHVRGTIDFLKVDAEGHEKAVLEGADWRRWRPRVVLVEISDWETWEPFLLAQDYLFGLFDGINRFYVRAEDRALLPAIQRPVNCTDEFERHSVWLLQQHIAFLERRLAELEGRPAAGPAPEEFGALALAFARRLKRLSARFPRAASAFRRIVRRAG
jgi:FkbM family methyltransferase